MSVTLLLVLNGTLLAAVYAFGKLARAGGIDALSLLAWQVGAAAVLITAVAIARRQPPQFGGTVLRYGATAGMLGVAVPNLATFSAIAFLPAGLVGIVVALSPAFTYTIAAALGLERVHAQRAAGVLLGFAGVLLIMLPTGALPDADAAPWLLVALAAPLALALGNIYRTRAWPPGLAPLAAASSMLIVLAATIIPLALANGGVALPSGDFETADLALLGAAAGTTAFYLTAFELQKRGGPVVTSQLGYVISVASLVLGMVFFAERPSAWVWFALGAVLAGIYVVQRSAPLARPSSLARRSS